MIYNVGRMASLINSLVHIVKALMHCNDLKLAAACENLIY